MTSKERIVKTLNYEKPDRIGRTHGEFWDEFTEQWRRQKHSANNDIRSYYRDDILIVYPDEGPFPSMKGNINEEGDSVFCRDSWGRVQRMSRKAKFIEVVDVAVKEKSDIDRLKFESPLLDKRYDVHVNNELLNIEELKKKYCVFPKIGGLFQRTSWFRGEEQFLVDIALDESFARELTARTAEHILKIGLEALKRWDLWDNGIWMFDDIGTNRGPVISPNSFEKIFYPSYKKVIGELKKAGVKKVILHSDGNIEKLLDMFMDAGIDGINPVEPRSGMYVRKLRERYGKKLCMIGCADNCDILPRGNREEIERMTLEIIEVAKGGGIVIGVHSVGSDITVENYDYFNSLIDRYGNF